MTIDTLLPKKIDAIEESYKSVKELNEVLSVAKEKNVRNIALTGPYGSGKSSVLITLMEDFPKGRNYLPISLATLQANNESLDELKEVDKNTELTNQQYSYNKEDNKENQTENLNRKIEYSILQQLIYREKADKVPNSRFRRIIHLSKRELTRYSRCVLLSLLCFFILFEPSFAKVDSIYNFFCWGNTCNLIFDLLSAVWLLYMLFYVIRYVLRSYSNSKLNKLNLKDAEIEVVENNSIFNRHLDEILYFFQATEYDVVIIEDLDRFGTPNIFLKLRELNQLINESKIVGRHITFVYAVKDDIFKDEERTKFFDYIITIIPVINPSNSKDKLKAALEAKGCGNEILDDDLSEMAFFVQDMRILTNIVNEYKQYRDKLCTTQGAQLNKTKLLAMIVYKNYYPQDFALLHRRQGKIYECINKKAYFISQALNVIDEKENNLKEQEREYKKDVNISKKDLRRLFLFNLWHKVSSSLMAIQIGNDYYELEQIAADEQLFKELLKKSSISYRYQKGYSYSNSANINFTQIDKEIRYSERLKLIENDSYYFQREYKQVLKEKTSIKSQKLQCLINDYKISETDEFKEIALEPMMNVFIRRGYIDEEYYDYISYFYEGMVSISDRDFLLAIKTEVCKPYDYHIDKIENFVKELKGYMFESDAILNIELLDYLATTEEYKDKFEHIMSRLERDMAPLQFLSQYHTEGKQGNIVFKHYIENTYAWSNIIGWQNTEERDNLIEAYLKYSSKLDDVAQEWLNNHFEFLVNHIDSISLDRALILAKNSYFKSLCYGSDDLLDYVIEDSNYEINLSNLVIITKHFCAGDITITEENLNYSRIKQTNNENFIAYVNNNIAAVIVVLKNTNKDDSIENILYILNLEDIEIGIKKQYLLDSVNCISDFSEITEGKSYDIAIETRIVLPTWENISFYYNNCSEDFPKILYDYINHYVDELSKESYPVGLGDEEDIYVYLFANNTLNVETYEKLLPSFSGVSHKVSLLKDLDNERLYILLKQNKLLFNEQTLTEINKTTILADYIRHHAKEFLQHLDWKYNWDIDNAKNILSSVEFSLEDKHDIVRILPMPVIQGSSEVLYSVIEIICKKQKVNVSDEVLIYLVKASDEINKKLELITYFVSEDCQDKSVIRKLLDDVGAPYSEIGDKSKNPLLPNNTLNSNLLENLRQIKFISSYKLEKGGKNLRVYPIKGL